MAKKKTVAVNKQTGISVSRSGAVLTISWKLTDFYDSQEIYWSIEGKNVITTLTGDASSMTYTIPEERYYPVTTKKLPTVSFALRGKMNGKYSAWVTAKYNFVVPNKPVVTKETLKFVWNTDLKYISGKGDPMVSDVEYQRVNSKTATQKNVVWGSSSSSFDFEDVTGEDPSGEVSYTETEYVEWFRCRTRGLNGASAWVYSYHIDAPPYKATGLSAKIAKRSVTLKWNAQSSAEHPIDYQYIQYCYARPVAQNSNGVPLCPDGVSWVTGANNLLPTAKTSTFTITQLPPIDQCLFIRVCTVCETHTSISDPVFALAGFLLNPTLVSIVSNQQTKQTTITFQQNTTVTLAKLAVINSSGKVLATVSTGTTVTVKGIPTNKNQFGIRAFQGKSATKTNMRSDNVFTTTGNIPLAPTNVTADYTEKEGIAELSWEIPWTDAEGAEISWADHEDAWMSTDEPETYVIDHRATQWNVANLISGIEYWFCVRLKDTAGIFSPYSDPVTLSFASAPGKPTLTSSAVAVQPGEAFQLAWTYETTDTTEQALAVIYDNGVELARTETNAQRMSVTPAWLFGSSHSLTVQTTSKSGYMSDMSDPVVVNVAPAPAISPISSAITSGISDGVLTDMPIVMEITGAGEGGQTTIKIERLKDFFVERPDGSVTQGYDGETIYAISYSGEEELVITPEDLVGSFDDGGSYRIIATVQDSIGQQASASLDFIVDWDHQAEAPEGTVTINADLSATVAAIAPVSYESGDTVDIYRLSVDRPELIVKGGEYGTNYVDPYPASDGAYRFVDVTANGDYINDTGIAWIDVDCELVLKDLIIDFDNKRLTLPYNLDISGNWEKDFKETKYLNGHVVGDWNAAVSRTASIGTALLKNDDRLPMIRELSTYAGVCHVRTPDGSSYNADVQVNEHSSYESSRVSLSLKITRVDPEGFEGIEEANYG